jgi:hypothetical protein
MKGSAPLVNLLYGYIGFAFFMVLLDTLAFHPYPNIIAGLALLIACYYIGRYSKD